MNIKSHFMRFTGKTRVAGQSTFIGIVLCLMLALWLGSASHTSAETSLSCAEILVIAEPLVPTEAYQFLSQTLTLDECEAGLGMQGLTARQVAEVFRTYPYVPWTSTQLANFRAGQASEHEDASPANHIDDHTTGAGGTGGTYQQSSDSLWMEFHSDDMGETDRDIKIGFDVEHHHSHFHSPYRDEYIKVKGDWKYKYRNAEIDSITFREWIMPGSYEEIRIESEYEYQYCRYGWWGCGDWTEGSRTVDCEANSHHTGRQCHTHRGHAS